MTAGQSLRVVTPGPLTTVQDLGRRGYAALGVSPSGAADLGAIRSANRAVGNDERAAALEITFGGLAVRAHGDLLVALAGAPCPATVDGSPVESARFPLADGALLRLRRPSSGLRTYLAVRGGIDVAPVLGSRSTDVLSGIAAVPPLTAGVELPVGVASTVAGPSGADPAGGADAGIGSTVVDDGTPILTLRFGPRDDWFEPDAATSLVEQEFLVTPDSNRVGLRLTGPVLTRSVPGELPSEGMVRGALQVPPSGQPTLLLADHPVTGGYPVIGVVLADDVNIAAQLRPGRGLRFRTGGSAADAPKDQNA